MAQRVVHECDIRSVVILYTQQAARYAEVVEELTASADARPSFHTCLQTAHAQ